MYFHTIVFFFCNPFPGKRDRVPVGVYSMADQMSIFRSPPINILLTHCAVQSHWTSPSSFAVSKIESPPPSKSPLKDPLHGFRSDFLFSRSLSHPTATAFVLQQNESKPCSAHLSTREPSLRSKNHHTVPFLAMIHKLQKSSAPYFFEIYILVLDVCCFLL